MPTPELLELVRKAEGFSAVPYRCPAGYWTIGFGHRIPSSSHPRITREEGEALLSVDVGMAEREARRLLGPFAAERISPRRLAALTDLVFNVGRDALDGANPSDLTDDAGVVLALRRGDWADAARRFRKWVNARDPKTGQLRPLPGLVARRETGARWIEEG